MANGFLINCSSTLCSTGLRQNVRKRNRGVGIVDQKVLSFNLYNILKKVIDTKLLAKRLHYVKVFLLLPSAFDWKERLIYNFNKC